jgi:hypothetical protein
MCALTVYSIFDVPKLCVWSENSLGLERPSNTSKCSPMKVHKNAGIQDDS